MKRKTKVMTWQSHKSEHWFCFQWWFSQQKQKPLKTQLKKSINYALIGLNRIIEYTMLFQKIIDLNLIKSLHSYGYNIY